MADAKKPNGGLQITEQEIADRALLVALFNMVGALAEKLTGKTPEVLVKLWGQENSGSWMYPVTGPARVRWVDTPQPVQTLFVTLPVPTPIYDEQKIARVVEEMRAEHHPETPSTTKRPYWLGEE